MSALTLKARLISLIAITLTTLIFVTLVQSTHAEQSRGQKVSLLLKGNHSANENVTVIVTLAGPRSGAPDPWQRVICPLRGASR